MAQQHVKSSMKKWPKQCPQPVELQENFSLDAMIYLLVDFLPGGKTISAACYIQILQTL
jgi:hypothetical protein